MKSVASAPGKVILFGEHFVVYGIKAILCSIDKRITATSQLIDEKIIKIKSILGESTLKIDSIDNMEKITPKLMKPFFYVANKVLEENTTNNGIEIVIESELPIGVGLGSSSAACVAVTASVNGLFHKLPKNEILKKAIDAERILFEETSGADLTVSTFGGLMLYDTENGFEHFESTNNLNFIIANSGQAHNTRKIVGKVKMFKERNEQLFNKLCKKEAEIIDEAIRSLKENDLNNLGYLMSKNQDLLEQIGVSTTKLDFLVKEAKKTSFGAKITGAGGGGCIISLVDNSNVIDTLTNMGNISEPFLAKIDHKGFTYN